MSEPIKIVVTAETAQAAAALQSFLHQNIDGLTQVEKVAAGAAAKTSEHFGGMVYQFRASMDAIRYAAMDGGPRAAFYAVDEAIRGLVSSGIKIGTIAPYIGAVGAAAAVSGAEWYLMMGGVENSTKKNEEFVKSMDKVAEVLKKIQDLQKGGIIGGNQATDLSNQVTGRKKMYVDHEGNLTPNPTETYEATVQTQMGYSPVMSSQQETVTRKNRPATQDEMLADAQKQLPQMSKDQLEAIDKFKALIKEASEEEMSDIGRAIAATHEKYERQRQEILETAKLAGAPLTPGGVRDPNVDKQAAAAVAEKDAMEAAEIQKIKAREMLEATRQTTEAQSKLKEVAAKEVQSQIESVEEEITARQQQEGVKRGQYAQQEYQQRTQLYAVLYYSGLIPTEEEYTKLIQDAAHKRAEAQKEYTDELRKELELKHAIAQAEAESQLKAIQENPFLTGQQKTQLAVPVLQALMSDNASTIGDLQNTAANSSDAAARLEAQQKIIELQTKQVELQRQMNDAVNSGDWSYQFDKATASLQTFTTWAQESAQAFQTAWQGAENSVSGGLTHLFMYGQQKGQWFIEMWNGMMQSMISSITKMVVHWVSQQLLMVVAHAAGEQQMTGATMAGSLARQAWHLAETVFHGLMVAVRVAAHIAGEIICTVVTGAQAAIRAMYHAIVAAIAAIESEASVPYVGVVLGIAAAAAVMAAAVGLMGGFQAGGYTGDGPADQVAGVVHAGEFVMPAHAVQSIGVGNLEAMRQGGSPSSAAVAAGVGKQPPHKIENAVYFDSQKMIDHLQSSDANEKYIVDVMRRNIHKFR